MDLNEVIRSLYEEKKKLDRLIASLESVSANGGAPAARPSKPRRTRRRQVSAERRKEISERMRKYWAARRAKAAKAQSADDRAGGSDSGPEDLASV